MHQQEVTNWKFVNMNFESRGRSTSINKRRTGHNKILSPFFTRKLIETFASAEL